MHPEAREESDQTAFDSLLDFKAELGLTETQTAETNG
jgi:hypothetical protein